LEFPGKLLYPLEQFFKSYLVRLVFPLSELATVVAYGILLNNTIDHQIGPQILLFQSLFVVVKLDDGQTCRSFFEDDSSICTLEWDIWRDVCLLFNDLLISVFAVTCLTRTHFFYVKPAIGQWPLGKGVVISVTLITLQKTLQQSDWLEY
jgi:hypothetical protein